ncbi:MAG: hypothetical protein IJO85_10155 [Lachnospiraceae bacterium]|nr:hypothetical protein [Lachnospiraceae bacterium]
MANISWTSNSINNFFNTSLGNPKSAFSGIYSSLNDSALIKSGSYYRLMDSYYKTVKSSDKTESDKKTESTTESESGSKIKNKVLDELLSKEKKESKVSNKILDELLTSEKTKSTAATYDNTGSKTQTAASTTIDQSI